jgi:hypothetical protein
LERSDKNKEMTHRFPCQDACASNRWISFLYVSCQVLQLLTLEAASRERLPGIAKLRVRDVAWGRGKSRYSHHWEQRSRSLTYRAHARLAVVSVAGLPRFWGSKTPRAQ